MNTIGATATYSFGMRYNAQEQRASNASYDALAQADAGRRGDVALGMAPFDSRPVAMGYRIADQLANLSRVDTSGMKGTHISELSEDEYQRATQALTSLIEGHKAILLHEYTDHSPPPASFIGGRTDTYARVTIGGSVVATIDNQGVVASDGPLGERLRSLLAEEVSGKNGPNLAQARAELVARLAGGRVEKVPSAMSQGEFDALPPFSDWEQPIAYEAMQRDPQYDVIRQWEADLTDIRQRRADYVAAHPEAGGGSAVSKAAADDAPLAPSASTSTQDRTATSAYIDNTASGTLSSVEETFLDWSQKTPIERIRSAVLEGLGLTEDQLKGLPETERDAIERQIEDAIKRSYGFDDEAGVGVEAP